MFVVHIRIFRVVGICYYLNLFQYDIQPFLVEIFNTTCLRSKNSNEGRE